MISSTRWQFWIDRGGTFTDIVARRPDGALVTEKLLSDCPEAYGDAATAGVRRLLGLLADEPIPAALIESVKLGTTVATNALLTRTGEPTVLAITQGFGDALRIAYQNRPHIFARRIVLPELLYTRVIEVRERIGAHGEIVHALDESSAHTALQAAYDEGLRAIAIVFMHGFRFPEHEARVARLARMIGFTQVSVSHEVSPLMKLIARGDTTVVDAYLSPVVRRYADATAARLNGARLLFMQSNGGLIEAARLRGKDSVLSGPAGGVVGAVRAACAAGFDKIIGFDMGGTSTDVSHFDGEFERVFETQIAGVRIAAPMMALQSIAAGGGSLLHFDGAKLAVGPGSAGANPGPACYRRGGPLTVTDCNVLLGKIQPEFFPRLFGAAGNESLDSAIVRRRFAELAREVNAATCVRRSAESLHGEERLATSLADDERSAESLADQERSAESLAEDYLAIAVANMANAIKRITIARGRDAAEYALCAFGGAAGQHACLVADALGISTVMIHPLAGVLSAYGIGLADVTALRSRAVESELGEPSAEALENALTELARAVMEALIAQGVAPARVEIKRRAHLRYQGTDQALVVAFGNPAMLRERFEHEYRRRYGFLLRDRALIVEAVSVEGVGRSDSADAPPAPGRIDRAAAQPVKWVAMNSAGATQATPLFLRERLAPGEQLIGPAIIAEANATTVVEPGWQAVVSPRHDLILTRIERAGTARTISTAVDPAMLEIFNNLFMAIAEEMGLRLQQTAHSVNIKERLDFSCAIFDGAGNLIANAPHIPVHLGSMGESVQTVLRDNTGQLRAGDVVVLNDPYRGGTHLPDVTAVTPVFDEAGGELLFVVASRGHHAEIGGITPGSMPPASRRVEQEGVLIRNFKLVDAGRLREAELLALLTNAPYPSRNPAQNLADLTAQVAANERGARELRTMVARYGLDVVRAYMGHAQDHAENCVRRAIGRLHDGAFDYEMDNGAHIVVQVRIDRTAQRATVDFTGTSAQQDNNFNAPRAVTVAAVLYVFRTLIDEDIPINAGCLRALDLVIPQGSLLSPAYPAAVVAGNVETSQSVVNALFGALGVLAGSCGTMSNFTFGNEHYQYYETISGGSAAGPGFDGASAVQTHMTNSRLTDPEVIEWRFPVRVENHSIRRGSGGLGQFRGGDGAVRCVRFLQPMTAALLSGSRRIAPFGMSGGAAGLVGRNSVQRAAGNVEALGSCAQVELRAGDAMRIETPGGGGFGEML